PDHDDRIRLRQLMGEFGFDRLAAEIYEALLTCGPLPGRHLLAIFSQSATRLERGLVALRDQQLVSMDYERFQPRYYAVNPAVTWQALGTDIVWGTSDTNSPSDVLRPAAPSATETRGQTCAE